MKIPPSKRPDSKVLPLTTATEEFKVLPVDNKKHTKRAVFLDRDGTINVERGYLLNPFDIELNPTVGEAIHTLNSIKVLTIVVTNQAAIDKKLLSVEQLEKIHETLWNKLSSNDAKYDALYYCPHSPEITPNCFCRKPKPGLIFQAAKDFGIDLASSFMIGDKLTDIQAGYSAGCKTILLLSGHGEKAHKEIENNPIASADFICQNLGEAVAWMLPDIL